MPASLVILVALALVLALVLLERRRRDAPRGERSGAVSAEGGATSPRRGGGGVPTADASQVGLVDALHEAVFSTSQDQRILTWNAAAQRIYGYGADEVIGRPVHEVLRTGFAPQESPDELDAEVLRSGQARRELRQRRQDGTEIVLDAHVIAVRDPAGAMAGKVYVARDVSEQKKAEAALRQSEAKFRAAFHRAGLAIALLDERGNLLEYNRAFREMLGYSDTELQEHPIGALLHPDDAPRSRKDFEDALAGRTDFVFGERRYVRKDGAIVQGILRSSIIRDDAGKFLYSVGLIEDVTEKRAVEAQLVFADRMASMGTLAAGVAHEINNPLSFILANLNYVAEELARQDPRPEEILRAVEETREGAVRVREIVRDLKMFSRADDRAPEGPVDVRQVLQSAIHLTENELRHRARLSVELQDVPPVHAPSHRLGQVFVNLLINAAQAITDPVPDRNEIRVRCATSEDGSVLVEVGDTGRGIAPENLARIFDPFFTTKPIGIGTGLGLSICHGIVTRLGGSIDVQSQLGHGSTFRVLLPPKAGAPRPSEPSAPDPTSASVRSRVVIVDDEPMVGKAVARALSADHDVTVLSSARAALDLVERAERIDVLICDLMMPGMSGMDLYAEIADGQPALRDRVVFLTGGAFTPAAREFLERVPNLRLEKPFEATALRAIVHQLLSDPR